jgi:hypothetical protein
VAKTPLSAEVEVLVDETVDVPQTAEVAHAAEVPQTADVPQAAEVPQEADVPQAAEVLEVPDGELAIHAIDEMAELTGVINELLNPRAEVPQTLGGDRTPRVPARFHDERKSNCRLRLRV